MNDRAIIERCQKNDMRAYEMIFKNYGQPMLRIALRLLGNLQDAEDAVQTSFVKLFRGIKNFKFKSKFSTYLYRILINNCYDILKKKPKHQSDLEHVILQDCSVPGLALELASAMEKLPGRMKECFVLFAVEGFKQEEIARILDINVGTVKANIFRAKEHLRGLLKTKPGRDVP